MTRYKFTRSDSVRGGKIRAEQAAQHRRDNPSHYEKIVRDYLLLLQPDRIEYEFPVNTQDSIVQYIDIAIWCNGLQYFIEVDGSHDWHNGAYCTKMSVYDEIKARYCYNQGYILIIVNPGDNDEWRNLLTAIVKGKEYEH